MLHDSGTWPITNSISKNWIVIVPEFRRNTSKLKLDRFHGVVRALGDSSTGSPPLHHQRWLRPAVRDLESYSCIRGVCTAWRSALPPPTPLLLTVSSGLDALRDRQQVAEPGQLVSASFLTEGRSFHLSELPTGGELVGSSNGWIAVDPVWPGIFLLNPLAGESRGFHLSPLRNGNRPVVKVVFAPNPAPGDYTAVAICGPCSVAYAKAQGTGLDLKWTVMDVAVADRRDQLVDLVYDGGGGGGGKVYCVTRYGDVHVLHVPGCRRRRPTRVAPLHSQAAQRADLFAPPYDAACRLTGAKNIFVSGGTLHQVWRNTSVAGRSGMAKDEVLVLRYDPKAKRRPCWDAVSDLGGCSVFVGKNNPVVLRPEDASGVRPNCVYWIDGCIPMVFDMVTRTSTTLHPLAAGARRLVCWFFLDDKVASIDGDARKPEIGA